jgi:hypothetical protein
MVVRAAECPEEYGGALDHLMYTYCTRDGHCEDLRPTVFAPGEDLMEDPRIFFYDGYWYMYYYASCGKNCGQGQVDLKRSKTPLDMSSWEMVAYHLQWHRNGYAYAFTYSYMVYTPSCHSYFPLVVLNSCAIVRDDGNHYVIYGEAGPLPGIGIATTTDFKN